ncbi:MULTISPECIES: type II toxin-antitoxin system PemK/MazF family toxin [Salinimicrobium]|uniref:mRNA interferase n=1 Tax=Salinimicrobium profundisediminis TaxID=2994553 RepID=A0A9X3CX84_9FLAO|nr:type II toxin-antitoxin system PemK/MazF family toxin [Salinimicrobium profundisediminis]MCX2838143.1 type II toxin-antitoxin system PemK/MazF family toxin [Salinimicrobium profundisediminis]
MELNQYSVILVNLDPTLGSEIKKTRPCVILSPNEMNKYLRTIVIAPMTTNIKKYPTRVPVRVDNKKGMIAIDQIRTVDRQRIIRVLDSLSKSEIQKCKEVLKETFVD